MFRANHKHPIDNIIESGIEQFLDISNYYSLATKTALQMTGKDIAHSYPSKIAKSAYTKSIDNFWANQNLETQLKKGILPNLDLYLVDDVEILHNLQRTRNQKSFMAMHAPDLFNGKEATYNHPTVGDFKAIHVPGKDILGMMAQLYKGELITNKTVKDSLKSLEKNIDASLQSKTENLTKLKALGESLQLDSSPESNEMIKEYARDLMMNMFECIEHLLREGVQNADGSWKNKEENKINISLDKINRTIKIEDYGCGMDKKTLEKVFFNIHASLYEALDHAAGKFGIGAISFFGAGHEYVKVDSRTVNGKGGSYIIDEHLDRSKHQPPQRQNHGTTIEIKLKPDSTFNFDLAETLVKRDCCYVKTPTFLNVNGKTEIINKDLTPESTKTLKSFTEKSVQGHVKKVPGKGKLDLLDHDLRLDSVETEGFSGAINCSGLETTFSRDSVREDPVLKDVIEHAYLMREELDLDIVEKQKISRKQRLKGFLKFSRESLFNEDGLLREKWIRDNILSSLDNYKEADALDLTQFNNTKHNTSLTLGISTISEFLNINPLNGSYRLFKSRKRGRKRKVTLNDKIFKTKYLKKFITSDMWKPLNLAYTGFNAFISYYTLDFTTKLLQDFNIDTKLVVPGLLSLYPISMGIKSLKNKIIRKTVNKQATSHLEDSLADSEEENTIRRINRDPIYKKIPRYILKGAYAPLKFTFYTMPKFVGSKVYSGVTNTYKFAKKTINKIIHYDYSRIPKAIANAYLAAVTWVKEHFTLKNIIKYGTRAAIGAAFLVAAVGITQYGASKIKTSTKARYDRFEIPSKTVEKMPNFIKKMIPEGKIAHTTRTNWNEEKLADYLLDNPAFMDPLSSSSTYIKDDGLELFEEGDHSMPTLDKLKKNPEYDPYGFFNQLARNIRKRSNKRHKEKVKPEAEKEIYSPIDDLALLELLGRNVENGHEVSSTADYLSIVNGKPFWTNTGKNVLTISGIDDLFSDGLKLNKDVSRYDLLSAVARHVKGMRYGPISDQEFNEHGSVLKAIHNTRHGLCLGINSYAAALLYELGEDDLRMAFNDKNPHGWLQVNHGTIENPDWTDYDCTPSKLTNSFARAMKRANQRYADKKKRMESFPYKTIKSAKKTITDLLKKKEETLKTKEDSLETSFPHPADLTELGKGIDKQQPPEEGTRVIEIINGDTLILIHSSETTYKGAAKTPSKEKFKLVPSPTPGIKTKQKKAVTKSKTVTDTKKKETVYTDTTKVDSSLTAVVGSDSLKQEEHPTMSEDSLRIKTQYQEPTKDPFDLIIPLSAVGLGILGTAGYLVYRKRRNGIEEILEQKIIEPIEPPQPVIIIDEHTLYVDEIKKLAEIYLPESVEFKLNRELESSQPRYTLTKDMVVINAHREKLHPLLVTLDYAAHILKDEKIAKTLITQYETLKEVRT